VPRRREHRKRRRAELEATIASAEADPTPPALHPHMATIYREKVERLADALAHEDEEQREAARDALRGFITAIVIPSGDGALGSERGSRQAAGSSRRRA